MGSGKTRIVDLDGQILDLDDTTGAALVGDQFDKALHMGVLFELSSNISIAQGGSTTWRLKTDALKDIHVIFSISAGGECLLTIREGVTVSVEGVSVSTFNINRQSDETCDCIAFSGATVSGGEDIFGPALVPGGRLQQASGFVGNVKERMLKKDTEYSLTVANTSGVTKNYTFLAFFYEEKHE